VALIQKPIDEINSNLLILENECLEKFKTDIKFLLIVMGL
jgi:hypothetical protein